MESKKVFIVEDVALNRMMLEMELTKNGFSVVGTAINAEEALEGVKKSSPDIILLDINLVGDRDGIWLGKELNKLEVKIPFIYITAYQDNYTTEEILETNPVGFIPKPISTIQLITTINVALKLPYDTSKTVVQLSDGKKILNIPLDEILYLQSEGNYINIYTENNHFLIRNKLGDILEKFPKDTMMRIHQRTAVSISKKFILSGSDLKIKNQNLTISDSYYEEVYTRFKSV